MGSPLSAQPCILYASRGPAKGLYRSALKGTSPLPTARLNMRDALLALAVVFVWGTNFVVVKLAITALPPLLFAALRFFFVLPLIFLLPRPPVRWANLAFYGLTIGVMQFALMYIAMQRYISPGLASLMMQLQVFFTIALSMWRGGERLRPHHLAALVLALAGMGVIAAHNGEGATRTGLGLLLGAALGWALGNQAGREAAHETGGRLNMLAYVVWSALFAMPPLLALSLWREGPDAILTGLGQAGPLIWAAVLWQSVGNTLFGYGCWAFLLARYPAATIAPLSLLVPIFGFAASALVLGEALPFWKIGATLLILTGLAVNLFWRPPRAATGGEPG